MGEKNTIYLIDAQSAFFQPLANAQCADASINEQVGAAGRYDGGVAFAAAGECGDSYHVGGMLAQIPLLLNSKQK